MRSERTEAAKIRDGRCQSLRRQTTKRALNDRVVDSQARRDTSVVPLRRRANGLLLHNPLKATGRDRLASVCVSYSATSKMTSSSIGIPKGRLATPITSRTDVFSKPKTSRNRPEAASATVG